jgi:hypothetical protein
MKESLLVEDGCFTGCLEDEVENGSFSELTRERTASHAAQYGNFGKHHMIQETSNLLELHFECLL